MKLFSEIKKLKVSLFKDKTVLTSRHLLEDEEVVDREDEIERIADYIKRVLAEGSFQILFIYGSSGLGKTAITRYVLNKLQTEDVEQALSIYIQLEEAIFKEESDEYICKVAKNLDEAKKLIELGFEYVTDMDGVKLFRKRK